MQISRPDEAGNGWTVSHTIIAYSKRVLTSVEIHSREELYRWTDRKPENSLRDSLELM